MPPPARVRTLVGRRLWSGALFTLTVPARENSWNHTNGIEAQQVCSGFRMPLRGSAMTIRDEWCRES
jgi:hypothetical protein